MDKTPLYQKIVRSIRQDILEGRLQAGDRLPSVREMMGRWNCTSGTVQRAYQDLARQGLVISRPGKGTHISGKLDLDSLQSPAPLRLANLVHRAEAFLLDALTTGYNLAEVQTSVTLAMDRWRALQKETAILAAPSVVRFVGSNDLAMEWISNRMGEIVPGANMQLTFTGSLHGLMLLSEGKGDLAGCHLWDEESNTYNEPFLRKLFPGETMALIHLAKRRMGFITAPGNPLGVFCVEDLTNPAIRYANRQAGSGTRVWLNATLRQKGIDPSRIPGFAQEWTTHAQVAREIAEDRADIGLGLESVATTFGLGFVPLMEERYDLVAYAAWIEHPAIAALVKWMRTPLTREKISVLPGYDFTEMGITQILSF